ncbi:MULTISPECIES: flagellin lysine-N-methylase [Paenibacillus]|uniref:flagellin lysine-N-methylase n=1 Tax=Paenibacillus TaxID=44249 RepID=UPI00289B99E3|nr:flagellin lysine-N-methylase [Paenibacillus odorifer]
MTSNLVETLTPQYIKEFTCIGSACEDTCCAGWKVTVDEETYKKYKKVKNYKIKSQLDEYVIRNRSNPAKDNVAKMKMNQSRCSFLNKENLCDIQLTLGEEFLCNTCAIYPRMVHNVNGVIERSLTVSCPEAARLILLSEDGLSFDKLQQIPSTRDVTKTIIHTNKEVASNWQDYFDEYRYVTISILQNRNYNIEERLLVLGLLYNELQECVNNNRINEIPDILGQYITSVENNALQGAFENISPQLEFQLRLCRELVVSRFQSDITSSRYLECSREMLSGLHIEKDASDEKILENYASSYEKYYAPFMLQHEYMLENYLVNYVFKNIMPLDSDSLFESYTRMILHYSLIKIHLIGMANYHQTLTKDLVIKLVQSLSKTFEHNKLYFRRIMNLIKDNDFMKLSYMSILIKH